jgi:hypothetical protein
MLINQINTIGGKFKQGFAEGTLYPIDLGPNKINTTSCNYLGSFFFEKLSLKKHLINMKTAVITTDPP